MYSWETYYARTLAHISHPAAKDTNDNDVTANCDQEDADLNDEDDPGTSWFSEHQAPEKVLHFLTRSSFPLSPRNTLRRRRGLAGSAPALDIDSHAQPKILDLGTGNGSMLALLQKRGGFVGQMIGVDYSAQSVELARELQRSRGHSAYRTDSEDEDEDDYDDGSAEEQDNEAAGEVGASKGSNITAPAIQFEEWDILGSKAVLSPAGTAFTPSSGDETLSWFPYEQGGFDIVLDKGTFDAISLASDAKDTRVCERYPNTVRHLIRKEGFLVVTSCNWTEEELVMWFTGAGGVNAQDRFVVWGRVEYPRFRFGGQEGQGVCTVCFQRVIDA